jgi:hypothetical protein
LRKKRQFFRRKLKLSKIAENCDHNIDPRNQVFMYFLANGFIYIPFPTHKQCTLSRLYICTQQLWYDFLKKPYTLAGFEPGSSVPEADALSTAPSGRPEIGYQARKAEKKLGARIFKNSGARINK